MISISWRVAKAPQRENPENMPERAALGLKPRGALSPLLDKTILGTGVVVNSTDLSQGTSTQLSSQLARLEVNDAFICMCILHFLKSLG